MSRNVSVFGLGLVALGITTALGWQSPQKQSLEPQVSQKQIETLKKQVALFSDRIAKMETP